MANWTGTLINISYDECVTKKATSFFEQKNPLRRGLGEIMVRM